VQEPPELSIIIVNWNTRDLLRDCLNSVYAETKATPFEVFVVDNASSDSSAEMVKREFPQVRLIENKDNLGIGRGNNQAIRESTGTYIVLLNPDTLVLSGALDKLAAFMRAHPHTDASAPTLLNPDGSPQPSVRDRYSFNYCVEFLLMQSLATYLPRLLVSKWGKRETHSRHPRQVAWVSGACVMARRETVDKVGLLDERYFLFADDTDWCYRLRQLGGRICFMPEAGIIHYGGQSVKQTDTGLENSYQSRYLFMKKHYGKVQAYFFRIMVAIDCFVAMCVIPLLQTALRGDRRREIKWKSRSRRRGLLWAIGRGEASLLR
jgi:GT2 family glycosyltransferase